MRTKNSCWFGFPPEACFLRPRARAFGAGCALAFWACFALTAARAISASEYRLWGDRLPPLEEDSEPDRALEQRPHREQLEERRHGIRAGKRKRDDGDDEVPDAAVLAQRARAEDAEADEPEDDEGQLEDDDDSEEDSGDERVVRARLDEMGEVRVVVIRQPMDRAREQHEVAEREAGRAERDGERGKPEDLPLRARLERGSEERPELPEDHRRRQDEARVQADGDGDGERLRDAGREQVAMSRRQRPVQPVEQTRVEREGHDRRHRDGADDDEQPPAQLFEVLPERRLLAVPKATRQTAHTSARRSRARSAGEPVRRLRRAE